MFETENTYLTFVKQFFDTVILLISEVFITMMNINLDNLNPAPANGGGDIMSN